MCLQFCYSIAFFFHLRDFLVFCSWERSFFIVVENLTFLSTPHQQRESAPGLLNAWHCLLMMQLTSSCKQTHPSWCWNSQGISLLWLQLQSYISGCCAVYTNRAESLKKLHVTRQQCKKPIKKCAYEVAVSLSLLEWTSQWDCLSLNLSSVQ